MQFFLFDLAATLLFLAGYLTLVTLRRLRALPHRPGTERTRTQRSG